MSIHDPRQVIEDIRNHLASHDRHLAFLLGAGTSSAVNIAPAPPPGGKPAHEPLIPGIEGLTELCRASVCGMGNTQAAAWDSLVTQCKEEGGAANVENVLSKVRRKIDALGDGETLLNLDRDQLSRIENAIGTEIAKAVSPADDKIPKSMPRDEFAAWVKRANRTAPLEIFTTNYDILLERSFELARVPVFDGFVGTHRPFFYPECLDDDDLLPRSKWIRLWKLHGSVNWRLEHECNASIADKRIVRTQVNQGGELILPSHRKYDESRKQPYVAYMDRLSRLLNSDHALLIACGYSFRDDHINAVLYGALDSRKTANIVALQFSDLKEDDGVAKVAARHSNLTVIGPNAGIISGRWGLWQLIRPVENKTASFMDLAFDSNASLEDQVSPAAASDNLRGRMRLGDFNYFCRFLNAMGIDIQ